jgi:hypothetical protein
MISLGADGLLPKEVRWYPYKASRFRALLRGAKLVFGKCPWQR